MTCATLPRKSGTARIDMNTTDTYTHKLTTTHTCTRMQTYAMQTKLHPHLLVAKHTYSKYTFTHALTHLQPPTHTHILQHIVILCILT
jgi:hypothetical protein